MVMPLSHNAPSPPDQSVHGLLPTSNWRKPRGEAWRSSGEEQVSQSIVIYIFSSAISLIALSRKPRRTTSIISCQFPNQKDLYTVPNDLLHRTKQKVYPSQYSKDKLPDKFTSFLHNKIQKLHASLAGTGHPSKQQLEEQDIRPANLST